MKNIIAKIKEKKIEIVLVLVILALGIFFRTYNFSRWLHFEVDQTYDYNTVAPAVGQGIGNLSLLGPTAGGGRSLRLGPAFYYMEYVSAKIFGNTPAGHAMNVLICSILAMPLFYLFSRRYFSVPISLVLLAVFSFSFYNILYSRFSWSPNVLPFLMIFSFYAMLKSVQNQKRSSGFWFLLAAALFTITTQIHFIAFFLMPPIALGFLIYKKPKFNWKIWTAAIAIIFLIYSPVIINEIATKGKDLNFFDKMIAGRLDNGITSKPVGLLKSISATIDYEAGEFFLINSGVDTINQENSDDYALDFDCQGNCSEGIALKVIIIILFCLGLLALFWATAREKDENKKDFLFLIVLWLFFSLVIYFFLIYSDYQMHPRFFLIVSPLAIIFPGLIFNLIKFEKSRIIPAGLTLIILILLGINIYKIAGYFDQLENSPKVASGVFLKDIFPDTNRVTIGQEADIADYIINKYEENKFPVYLETDHEYEPAIWYFLEKKGLSYQGDLEQNKIDKQSNDFLLLRSATDMKKSLADYSNYNISEEKDFGTLTLFYLTLKDEILGVPKKMKPDDLISFAAEKKEISQLLTWNKIFSSSKKSSD